MAKLAWMRSHGVVSATWSSEGALVSVALTDLPPTPSSPEAEETETKPQPYVMRRRGSAVPGLREAEDDAG